MNKLHIALCAIIKDEEKCIMRMINSCACINELDNVELEYYIFDTGSTDNTMRILNENNIPYQQCPFTNFVETKNYVLENVPNHIDYILFMDADEWFDNDNAKNLISYLLPGNPRNHNYDYLVTTIIDQDSNYNEISRWSRIRCWKNSNNYRFIGPNVHEAIDTSTTAGNIVCNCLNIIVNHQRDLEKNRLERLTFYIEQINNYLVKNPNDMRALFYIARTYLEIAPEHDDIIYCLKNAVHYFSKYICLYYNNNYNHSDELYVAYLGLCMALSNVKEEVSWSYIYQDNLMALINTGKIPNSKHKYFLSNDVSMPIKILLSAAIDLKPESNEAIIWAADRGDIYQYEYMIELLEKAAGNRYRQSSTISTRIDFYTTAPIELLISYCAVTKKYNKLREYLNKLEKFGV